MSHRAVSSGSPPEGGTPNRKTPKRSSVEAAPGAASVAHPAQALVIYLITFYAICAASSPTRDKIRPDTYYDFAANAEDVSSDRMAISEYGG